MSARSRVAVVLFALAAACRSVEVDPCELPGEGPFLPLALGNWWLYDSHEAGTQRPIDKALVVREEVSPGRFRLEKIACDPDNTWIDDTPDGYLWPRKLRFYAGGETKDIYYEPARTKWRTRDDGGLCEGAEWWDDYDQVTVEPASCDSYVEWEPHHCSSVEIEPHHDHWRVVSRKPCQVGEYEYECSCQWRDDDGGAGTFCYARGVGKVEEDTDTVERLVDFCIDGRGPGGQPYAGGVCPEPPDPTEGGSACMPAS